MNIYIGENIKRLRKEKNITQERLAEQLNISSQAISKWERSETYPDISMLIPIASFFDVSTDELLGVDKEKDKRIIQSYLDEHQRLSSLGKNVDKFNLILKAYKEYPNDFRITEKYAWGLFYDPNHLEKPYGFDIHKDELYDICDRILDDCKTDQIRYSALSILCGLYNSDKKLDKALETARRFPNYYFFTANEQIEDILERGSSSWLEINHKNIQDLCNSLIIKIRNNAIYRNISLTEKIEIFNKGIDLINVIYNDKDYGFTYYYLCELNIHIANCYIELGEYDTAIDYIEKGLCNAKLYDDLPKIYKHKSVLLNTLKQNLMDVNKSDERKLVAREIYYLNKEFYDKIKKNNKFTELINKFESLI